jgi:pilus assembly protein CpaF
MPGVCAAPSGGASIAASGTGDITLSDLYQDLKFRLFTTVLESLEQRGVSIAQLGPVGVREAIMAAIAGVLSMQGGGMQGGGLNSAERSRLAADVEYEITGLGPLEPLLQDTGVDDIIVNGPRRVYVERKGRMAQVPVRFRDDAHLMNIIQRMVSPIGRRVDESSPFVDARLADGSRVNIVIPPIALDGPMVSIRKFRAQPMRATEFVRSGSLSKEMMDFLACAVRSRLNMLICGGTGSGKTTLLNMLSGHIGETERLITIEDAAELQLHQSHVVRLETRPPSPEGAREISARDLVRNALRMRPDRIILGEVRGAEAVEMLQAMSTGHDGSMATIHANTPRDALARLEMLLGFGGLQTEPRTLRRYIVGSVQVLVQVQRMANGRRRVTSVSEVTGLQGDAYSLNVLHTFEEDPPLSGLGEFVVQSRRPHFEARLAQFRPVPAVPDEMAGAAWG